jgi:hypothetical protein
MARDELRNLVVVVLDRWSIPANHHSEIDSGATNLVDIFALALGSDEMFGIFRSCATIEPLGRIELGRASSRPVKVVQKCRTISNVNDSSSHCFSSRVAFNAYGLNPRNNACSGF